MKTNVAVVFGGRSVEHEIAIISAVQAMASMDREKYEIYPVYMNKNGVFTPVRRFLTSTPSVTPKK